MKALIFVALIAVVLLLIFAGVWLLDARRSRRQSKDTERFDQGTT